MFPSMEKFQTYPPSKLLLLASILAYLACLPMDSFCTSGNNCSGWPSWSVLSLGWVEMFLYPIAGISWFANLALLLAWQNISLARRKTALRFSVGALVLGAWFMLVGNVAVSESGSLSAVTGFAPGYWLWLASMGLAAIGSMQIKPVSLNQSTT